MPPSWKGGTAAHPSQYRECDLNVFGVTLSRLSVLAASVAIVTWCLATSAFAQDYQLQPGDVLEISVLGIVDSTRRSPVNLDGEIAYPLAGPVKVSGLTLAEVRKRLQEILPTKVYRHRTPDGREVQLVVLSDEITVNIAEYRPVYLNGDVSRPGARLRKPA